MCFKLQVCEVISLAHLTVVHNGRYSEQISGRLPCAGIDFS